MLKTGSSEVDLMMASPSSLESRDQDKFSLIPIDAIEDLSIVFWFEEHTKSEMTNWVEPTMNFQEKSNLMCQSTSDFEFLNLTEWFDVFFMGIQDLKYVII